MLNAQSLSSVENDNKVVSFKSTQTPQGYYAPTAPIGRDYYESQNKVKKPKDKEKILNTVLKITGLVTLAVAGVKCAKDIQWRNLNLNLLKRPIINEEKESLKKMIDECKDPKIQRIMKKELNASGRSNKKIEALSTLASIEDSKAKLIDIDKAVKILDDEVIGMEEAKTQIIDHLKFRNYCIENDIKLETPFVLALDGPAGTAKTTLANAVAKACDMPHKEISMAGMTGKTSIRGTESVFSGASWGDVADAQIEHKTRRIVYTFDEIEKAGTDTHHGKTEDALLPLMDNRHYIADDFLEIPIDVMDSIIITTSNDYEKLSEPMKSRLSKVIKIKEYDDATKKAVAEFKMNKFMKKYKMEGKVKLTDDAWKEFLKRHKDKTGGREVTNEIEAIMEKIPIQDAYKTATTDAPYMITPDILKKLLASLI